MTPLAARPHIRDGFPGQRMIVLPRPVIRAQLASAHAPGILPTDIGYFPNAAWHDVDRPRGTEQMVIILCVSGHGWARLRGKDHRINPGNVLVLPPNVRHAYGAAEFNPWTIYWLHLAGHQVASIYQRLSLNGLHSVFSIGKSIEPFELIQEIEKHIHHSYGDDQLLLASLIAGSLMAKLITLHASPLEAADARARIEQTITFLRHRVASSISVGELARLANLSPSHFAALFKKLTGYSVLDFSIRVRMQRAAHLLDTTRHSVKMIAAEVGYSDPLYFSRTFRRVHELSPAQYRKIKKG